MEYHVASLDYVRYCIKTDLHLELSTINHIFVPENNTEYDSEDIQEMEEKNIPEFIPVTLCNYRPDGISFCDANDIDDDHIQISFHDFKKEFWKDSKKRDCPICQRKLKLLKKEGK